MLKASQAITYTKTETDAAIANKANTADMTAALALKVDKATTYTISQSRHCIDAESKPSHNIHKNRDR